MRAYPDSSRTSRSAGSLSSASGPTHRLGTICNDHLTDAMKDGPRSFLPMKRDASDRDPSDAAQPIADTKPAEFEPLEDKPDGQARHPPSSDLGPGRNQTAECSTGIAHAASARPTSPPDGRWRTGDLRTPCCEPPARVRHAPSREQAVTARIDNERGSRDVCCAWSAKALTS